MTIQNKFPTNLYPNTTPAEGFNIGNINNGQIDMMANMMKSQHGKDMMKNIYKSQYGMDLGDQQLDMMSNMMTPDTLQAAQKMQANGGLPNQPGQMPQMPMNMMNMFGSGANGNPSQDLSETQNGKMPQMPSMDDNMTDMLTNSNMINPMFDMVKANPGILRGLTATLGEGNPVSKFIQNRTDAQLGTYVNVMQKMTKVG